LTFDSLLFSPSFFSPCFSCVVWCDVVPILALILSLLHSDYFCSIPPCIVTWISWLFLFFIFFSHDVTWLLSFPPFYFQEWFFHQLFIFLIWFFLFELLFAEIISFFWNSVLPLVIVYNDLIHIPISQYCHLVCASLLSFLFFPFPLHGFQLFCLFF
jgi:hypothetical protein